MKIKISLKAIYKYFFALTPFLYSTTTAQTYKMPIGTGALTVSACNGIFTDSGDTTGNYAANTNSQLTLSPASQGQYASVTFTGTFDLDKYDFLAIYDGNGTNSTCIAVLSGTVNPGTFTASGRNPSGCLTFAFISNATKQRPGWRADISCSAIPGIYLQPFSNKDCMSKRKVCSKQTFSEYNTGIGNVEDITQLNGGCLAYEDAGHLGIAGPGWYFFTVATSGTLGLDIMPDTTTADDYDFAIWAAGATSPPSKYPVRCTYFEPTSAVPVYNTGMNFTSNDITESSQQGDGYLKYMDVVAGQTYTLYITRYSGSANGFTLQFTGTATLDCSNVYGGDVFSNRIAYDQSICYGSSVFLTGTTNPKYHFQWQSSNSASGPFVDISGATTNDFQTPVLAANTYYVRRALSDSDTTVSTTVAITVIQPIHNNIISSDQTICNATVPAPLTGTNPTGGKGVYYYEWQQGFKNTNGTYSFNDCINGDSSNYYFSNPFSAGEYYFRRIIRRGAGQCSSDTSNYIKISVEEIKNNTIFSDQLICNNTVPNELTGLIPTGGNDTTYTYQWQSWNAGVYTTITGATRPFYLPPAVTAPIFYLRVASSKSCAPIASNFVFIDVKTATVNPEICVVSVDSASNKNLIMWHAKSNNEAALHKIYRVDNGNMLTLLGSVNKDQFPRFLDLTSDPASKSYTYRLTSLDSCGNESDTSAAQSPVIHCSIYLTSAKGNGNEQVLTWNSPNTYNKEFRLYREVNNGEFIHFADADPQALTLTDTSAIAAHAKRYLLIAAGLDSCIYKDPQFGALHIASDARSNYAAGQATNTGINGPEAGYVVKAEVFPNPTSGSITIILNVSNRATVKIEMTNVLGEVLINKDYAVQNAEIKDIDVSSFPTGIYYLKIISEKGFTSTKIIKQ